MKLEFKSDTKHRKEWFTGLHFSHPAKMHLSLQLWLIENFSKEGETILDCMAGSGTVLVACSLGRHVIAVELEQKFVDMMKGNWQKIQERGPQLGYSMGTATILQGDARRLEGILVDKCIFSPPYAEAQTGGGISAAMRGEGSYKVTTSLPSSCYQPSEHGKASGQIGNLPYGSIDKVITSPPHGGNSEPYQSKALSRIRAEMGRDQTKPSAQTEGYGDNPDNVGNLSYGDISAVITSPPYDEGGGHGGTPTKCGLEHRQAAMGQGTEFLYGKTDGNIGNLKSDSYLSQMLLVYSQCFKVLRPGGLMVLVVKNFIRNKKIVRLDLDTIKICEQAGFNFKERFERKLTQQSFWRVIYSQKYPDVEQIKGEDILVFEKCP